MATVVYRADAPGDWGTMMAPPGGVIGTDRLADQGQNEIFYRFWRVENAPATLLWLHGLGAHSGWFIDIGNSLSSSGISMYAMDHHGFGRSGGTRGHTTNWHIYLRDIDRMVERIRADAPNKPIFILGHSMGGVFAIQYAAEHQEKLAGVLLLNPWIKDQTKVAPGTVLSIVSGGIFGSKQLVHLPDTKKTADMTPNPEANQMLQNDPYWVFERTKGFYWQITEMRGKTLARAQQVRVPVLMLQGEEDATVFASASRQAFDRLASQDKTFTLLSGYEHDPEFHIDRSLLDSSISTWIISHSQK